MKTEAGLKPKREKFEDVMSLFAFLKCDPLQYRKSESYPMYYGQQKSKADHDIYLLP